MVIAIIIAVLIAIAVIYGFISDHIENKKKKKEEVERIAKARLNLYNQNFLSQEAYWCGWSQVKVGNNLYAFINRDGNTFKNLLVLNQCHFTDGYALVNIVGKGQAILKNDGTYALPPEESKDVERTIKHLTGEYYLLTRKIKIDKKLSREENYIIRGDGSYLTKDSFSRYQDFKEGIFYIVRGSNTIEIAVNGTEGVPPYKSKKEIGPGLYKLVNDQNKCGIYDENAKALIIPFKYSDAIYIKEQDTFIVKGRNHLSELKTSVISRKGAEIVPPLFDDIEFVGNQFYRVAKRATVGQHYLHGIYDANGNMLVQPNFSSIYHKGTDFFVTTFDKRCGKVNKNGLSALEFDECKSAYFQGHVYPERRFPSMPSDSPIGSYLVAVPEYLIVRKDSHWGVANHKGEIIVPIAFDDIDSVEDNTKAYPHGYFILKQDNKYGVANVSGKICIPIIFDEIKFKVDFGAEYPPHSYSKYGPSPKDIERYDRFCQGKPSYFIVRKEGKKYSVTPDFEPYEILPTRTELNRRRYEPDYKENPYITPLPRDNNETISQTVNKKKQYIFFDTETSGLPLNYKAPVSDTENWPRLVQLSWIIVDSNFEIIEENDFIIYPEGFSIPTSASQLHGITTEIAREEGLPIEEVLENFMQDFAVSTACLGHNIAFDKKVVACELYRMGLKDTISLKPSYCTMESSTNFCAISGNFGYKYPKLQELHYALFGYEFEDAHNSLSDVKATLKCFKELKARKIMKI